MLKYLFPFFLTPAILGAQPTIQWAHAYGGTQSDEVRSVKETPDGAFVVAGVTSSTNGDVTGFHGGIDFWVLKLDSTGEILWKNTYGGTVDEQPYAMAATIDSGCVVVGYSRSTNGDVSGNHGNHDFWIIKLDRLGNLQWQKCLGGSASDHAWDVQQTSDHGFILAGWSNSVDGDLTSNHGDRDFWIVKLDSLGNLDWQRSHGGSHEDMGYAIKPTMDGGYIVGGESSSIDGNVTGNHGGPDCWILKLNYEGKIEWQKSLGGISIDRANDLIQLRTGGYIVLGQTYSNNGDVSGNHGGTDFWVVKLSEQGDLEWQRAFGGTGQEYARSIWQTQDGGLIMTGQTQSTDGDVVGNDGGADVWVVKLTEIGMIQWQLALGGTDAEWGNSIQQTRDHGFIVAGYAWSNNGDVSGVHGYNDFWVVKLAPESTPTTSPNTLPLVIYPNPAQNTLNLNIPQGETTLYVSICNISGQEISRFDLNNNGLSAQEFPLDSFEKGIYLLSAIGSSGRIYYGKFVKE